MPDKIVMPGGFDEWGHRWTDFVLDNEHTAFEWCMIYVDRNPAAYPNRDRATAVAQEMRLAALGAMGSNEPGPVTHITSSGAEIHFGTVWDDRVIPRTANAIYRELAEAIANGRFEARRVYLDDRPRELDPTLCVLDAEPVLAIAHSRRDYGQYIAQLMAKRHPGAARRKRATFSEVRNAITAVYDAANETGAKPPNLVEIIKPVQAMLDRQGFEASGRVIQKLAADPQHDLRRRKPGRTIASERRK
jgi:hypothetical protein